MRIKNPCGCRGVPNYVEPQMVNPSGTPAVRNKEGAGVSKKEPSADEKKGVVRAYRGKYEMDLPEKSREGRGCSKTPQALAPEGGRIIPNRGRTSKQGWINNPQQSIGRAEHGGKKNTLSRRPFRNKSKRKGSRRKGKIRVGPLLKQRESA